MFEKQSVICSAANLTDRDADDPASAHPSRTFLLSRNGSEPGEEPVEVTLSTMIPAEFVPTSSGGTIALRDNAGEFVASLTLGAHTVALAGPERTFRETGLRHSVTHGVWIRSLPRPFDGVVDLSWVRSALAANRAGVPDVLAMALQYVRGAPAILDGNMQIAGDSKYGPVKKGKRQEGSDFNDYLGLTWSYAEGLTDFPERAQFRCLDCSGFMRMIWGFRSCMEGYAYEGTIPLSYKPLEDRCAIPRRANEIFEFAPGVIVVPNCGERPDDYCELSIGDLVFFDADTGDGPRLDHVGMYLGRDEAGHDRFISSRKTRNGPTIADEGGASILDGDGYYAQAFRSVRRL